MTDMLRREYALCVLQILWRRTTSGALIDFRMRRADDAPLDLGSVSAKAIGLDSTTLRAPYQDVDANLPDDLTGAIREATESSIPPHEPLWIELRGAVGDLPAVPWERVLRKAGIPNPLHRIPNHLVSASHPLFPVVVLCGSEPEAKQSFHVTDMIQLAIDRLREVNPMVEIHVFQDRGLPSPTNAIVHDPSRAPARDPMSDRRQSLLKQGRAKDSTLRSPWLRWIESTLRGRTVHLTHFFCHGYIRDDLGFLAFAEHPNRNTDRRWSRFVGEGELAELSSRLGVQAIGISSPEHDYQPIGARYLVHQLSSNRLPFAWLHSASRDPDFAALREIYALHFNQPHEPVESAEVSAYCAPAWFAQDTSTDTQRGHSSALPEDWKPFTQVKNAPAWASAAELRFDSAASLGPAFSDREPRPRAVVLEAEAEAGRILDELLSKHGTAKSEFDVESLVPGDFLESSSEPWAALDPFPAGIPRIGPGSLEGDE